MAPFKPQSILLVDDEPDVLSSNARVLGTGLPGVTILTFSNGQDAFKHIKKHDVDVIISDLQMPNMDGMDLLTKCQKARPETFRILLTAFPDAAYIHDARQAAQITEAWAKPFHPPAFIEVVRRLLQQRRDDQLRR